MKKVRVPGSCGELVQGIDGEKLFLVTCPVNLYSTASIVNEKWRNKFKIAKARRLTLEYLQKKAWLNIKVETELLSGKGMASSSADIVATIELIAWEMGSRLSIEEIGKLATKIEPTDGVFCPGIVKYGYRTGELLETYGTPPKMEIMIFDGGGTINTMYFNKQSKLIKHYKLCEKEIGRAQKLVLEGIKNNDPHKIGSGATLSGYLNQALLYKPYFEDITFISEKYGAVGVNVAHSGTVMGVLFPDKIADELKAACKEEILKNCSELKYFKTVNMISGGIELEDV